jgi:hypothetical protein
MMMVVDNQKIQEAIGLVPPVWYWNNLKTDNVRTGRGRCKINRKELYRSCTASLLPHSVMRRAEAQVTWTDYFLENLVPHVMYRPYPT